MSKKHRRESIDCLARVEINWQTETTREQELEAQIDIMRDILNQETKRADDAESALDLLKQDNARLTRLARYQASKLPLVKTEECFSCDKDFTPESHNDLDQGYFCDDCLENKE